VNTLLSLAILVSFSMSCSEEKQPLAECEPTLFGSPSTNTGLDGDQCTASCACGETSFTPPSYTDADVAHLESFTLVDGPGILSEDPYQSSPDIEPDNSQFCAVIPQSEANQYRLANYDTESEAVADGAMVTHQGACGQCSSLQNLAVYMAHSDLTDPVRNCGIEGIVAGEEANIECLMEIGFDLPCAQIWYFNTQNTRNICLDVCLESLNSTHHKEDGSLNDCIQCDEDNSGPVFKTVSGRTRRNSGLPSALCRPCDTVFPVDHTTY
jgi:hypothetical protein